MDDLHRTIAEFAGKFYDFHENPTIEVFNEIIATEGSLFGELPPDPRDVACCRDKDETDEEYRDKMRTVQKTYDEAVVKMKKTGYHQPIKYCVTGVLSWVHAAVKEFPWLAEDCCQPLIIERAHHFTCASYSDRIIELSCDNNAWADNFKWIIGQNLARYTASGNQKYIDQLSAIVESAPLCNEDKALARTKIVRETKKYNRLRAEVKK